MRVDARALEGCAPATPLAQAQARVHPQSQQETEGPGSAETALVVPAAGQTIGRYLVIGPIGQGAMGQVFAAYDPELDRRIAIKLLRRGGDRSRASDRMLHEAQALARLVHPNIVTVYDVGKLSDGAVFIAMELLEGVTLTQWIAGRRSGRRAFELVEAFVAAGRGLAAAHAAGIIHRDFKPDNVFVTETGRVVVLDFGLARSLEASSSEAVQALPLSVRGTMTQDGKIAGTPAFMSPEQALGAPLDTATDQFSFCLALWRALYGVSPFSEDVPAAARAVDGVQAPPTTAGVPRAIRRALQRGLAHDPAARHPSMSALVLALDRSLRQRRRVIGFFTIAAVVIATLVGARMIARRGEAACDTAVATIDQVWNSQRREALGDAFRQRPELGDPTDMLAALDGFASAWKDERRAACRPRAEVASSADVRAACLDGAARRVGALVDVLLAHDHRSDPQAVREAVAEIPAPTTCTDDAATWSPPPLPESPELAAAVTRLRLELEHARAMAETGGLTAALEQLARIEQEAQALDFEPFLAEAVGAHALTASNAQFGGAGDLARRAYLLAERTGRDQLTLAALRLLAVSAARRREFALGDWYVEQHQAIAHRAGSDPNTLGRGEIERGMLMRAAGRAAAAEAAFRSALELLADHPQGRRGRLRAYDMLAGLQLDEYQHDAAVGTLDLLAEELGDDTHAIRGNLLLYRARVAYSQDDWVAARREAEAALQVFTDLLGPRHHNIAAAHQVLARVIEEQDIVAALVHLARAREILEAADSGPSALNLRVSIARMYANLGFVDAALAEFADCESAFAELGQPLARSRANVLEQRGHVLLTFDDPLSAIAAFDRADEVRRAADAYDPYDAAGAEHGRADAALALGDTARALAHASMANDVAEAAAHRGEGDAAFLADTRRSLALALAANRQDPARQLELAQRAFALYVRSPRRYAQSLRELLELIARVRVGEGP